MKLRRLDLENFRQFYGVQGLSFSTDPEKNVTLIYGSNGAGKTTILNAFTWGLYGETTPGLAEAEWLINNLAWSRASVGEAVTARVGIEFEDQDNIYELTREQTAHKHASGDRVPHSAATLRVTDIAGQNEELHNLEGAVGSILPKRLHRFAFFDGERDIEHLASPEATEQIKDAIKTVLGLEIIERAMKHTKLARTSHLNKELAELGDDRDLELAGRLEQLSAEDARLAGEHDQLAQNLNATNRDLARVEEELSRIQAAQKLQEQRQEIVAAVEATNERIMAADRGVDEALQRRGFLAFVPSLIESTEQRSTALQEHGEIPAPIKRSFVQSLLADGHCICGATLSEGSPEQESVMAWFEKAGLPDVEARWNRLDAHATNFRVRRDELYRYLHETLGERSASERERKIWEQKESEIEEEMTAVDDEAARAMNAKRREMRLRIEKLNREIGSVEQRRRQIAEGVAQAKSELDAAKSQSKAAEQARARVRIAGEVEEVCRRLLDVRTQQTRSELDERLKVVFGAMCFRPYVPALTDDFRLTLSSMLGGDEIPVAKSTGESQILALSFVGVMAELARTRFEEQRDGSALLSFHGGIFPLVLDAVFGTLDDTYQEGVAASLPTLAPQVIVLVTRRSATEAIRERLWPRTGKTAVCTLFTSAHGTEDTMVEIPTGEAPYRVTIDDDSDRSEIVEM
jgi:DNA sulfur modification protein DndD